MGKTIAQKALATRAKTAGKKAIDLDKPEQEKKGFEMYATGKSPYIAGTIPQKQKNIRSFERGKSGDWAYTDPGGKVMDALVEHHTKLSEDPGYELPDYDAYRQQEWAKAQAAAGLAARMGGVGQVETGGGRYGTGQIGAAKVFGDLAGQYGAIETQIEANRKADLQLQMEDKRRREEMMLQTLVAQGKITSEQLDRELRWAEFEDKKFTDGLSFVGDSLASLQGQYGPLNPQEMKDFYARADAAMKSYMAGDEYALINAGLDLVTMMKSKVDKGKAEPAKQKQTTW